MERNSCRTALDSVELREGFRQDTLQKLTRATQQRHKKEITFIKKDALSKPWQSLPPPPPLLSFSSLLSRLPAI